MKTIIRQSSFFWIAYALFCVAGYGMLWYLGKEGSFLQLNAYHRPWLDAFFQYFTHAGNGWTAVILSLLCYFVFHKRKLALVLFFAYALTGIAAQVIKPLVEAPRPGSYFTTRLPFFIDAIQHHGFNSFPSGHTVTAFATAAVLALYTRRSWLQALLIAAAVLAGYSRIYLSQHFLADVMVGSLIGVAGAGLCEYWFRKVQEEQLSWPRRRRTDDFLNE